MPSYKGIETMVHPDDRAKNAEKVRRMLSTADSCAYKFRIIRPDGEVKDFSILTSREREVLQLIAEGKTNKEIAALLKLSIKTVDTHRTHLMDKLRAHSTAELVVHASRIGMVE